MSLLESYLKESAAHVNNLTIRHLCTYYHNPAFGAKLYMLYLSKKLQTLHQFPRLSQFKLHNIFYHFQIHYKSLILQDHCVHLIASNCKFIEYHLIDIGSIYPVNDSYYLKHFNLIF